LLVDEVPYWSNDDAGGNSADGGHSAVDSLNDREAWDTLRILAHIAKLRLQKRVDGGSMEAHAPSVFPDLKIKVKRDDDATDGWSVDVKLGDRRSTGAARRIVTEMMILAGEATARFCYLQGVKIPFRAQSMKDLKAIQADLDALPGQSICRTWLCITRLMNPSHFTSKPKPHEGLGLQHYVQVTSPLRRYVDLATHYQLKAFLRGDPLPYSTSGGGDTSLVEIARETTTSVPRHLERTGNDYWLKEYLRRNSGQTFAATVIGVQRNDGPYKLLLDDVGAIVDLQHATPLALGEEIVVVAAHSGDLVLR